MIAEDLSLCLQVHEEQGNLVTETAPEFSSFLIWTGSSSNVLKLLNARFPLSLTLV